jgi:hypothetical protein
MKDLRIAAVPAEIRTEHLPNTKQLSLWFRYAHAYVFRYGEKMAKPKLSNKHFGISVL